MERSRSPRCVPGARVVVSSGVWRSAVAHPDIACGAVLRGVLGLGCSLSLLACGLLAPRVLLAQEESPTGGHPGLGGSRGLLRNRISRHPGELAPFPDVLQLNDGEQREAYFLEVHGDWLVYYVRETETSWLKEETPRKDVESIEFYQHLDTSPIARRKVLVPRRQPVLQGDRLDGVYGATQGGFASWTFDFQSQAAQAADSSQDKTDHGVFELRSDSRRIGMDREVEGSFVRGEGRYYLYAPGTIGNEERVLLLADVILSEADVRGRETSLSTQSIGDEAFILELVEDGEAFRLLESNLGTGAWSGLADLKFRRPSTSPPGRAPSGGPTGSLRDRGGAAPAGASSPGRGGPRRRASDDRTLRAEDLDAWLDSVQPRTRELETSGAVASRESIASGVASAPQGRWGVRGWRRPRSLLCGRR